MKVLKAKRIDPLLIGIVLLAAFLNTYGIWKDQYANAYYTAAVTSMLQSFHNFFFASFDPGGFVTVDKPPVAFWIQTLFAWFFGVHGWSVILPQALAGVGSVLLIYTLVKPSFGKTSARLAALVAACTPIAVAVSRTNNVDSILVFFLLVATWMLFRAVKTKKWIWSVAAFAMIGVSFNVKMLQAYMVLPAFYLFYWLAFKVNWKKKLGVLAVSTAALLLVSLSWPLIVDSIPQESRPYIGGSQTNSVLELVFGYNGLSRLTGQGGPGGGTSKKDSAYSIPKDKQTAEDKASNSVQNLTNQNFKGTPSAANGDGPSGEIGNGNPPDGQMKNGGPGGGNPGNGGSSNGMFNTGTAGPLRLFQSQLSGQISWLLPFALLSSIGLLMGIRRKKPLTDKQKESLFWIAWLLPIMGFFSVAQFFHQYYLIMLAPPIAALTGAGWVELYQYHRQSRGWKQGLLPIGLLATTAFQVFILWPYKTQIGISLPLVVGILGAVCSLILLIWPFLHRASNLKLTDQTKRSSRTFMTRIAAIGGILILLAAPFFWAMTPMIYGDSSMLPAAGPQSGGSMGSMSGQGSGQQNPMQSQARSEDQTQTTSQTKDSDRVQRQGQDNNQESIDSKLLNYLTVNNTGEKFLFATTNATTAEAYIIKTGKAVMAMGGFSGSDPILTVDKLKQMIADKEIKYVLFSSGGAGGGSSDVQTWIQENGTVIPSSEWQSNSDTTGGMGRNSSSTLYQLNS